jgi:DHA1 family multidrug resistance protein-like MFS transporter
MFLSPLQELPILGRNPVYMATLFLFVIFQIPIVMATNMNTVLAMRFMTGFFGSPALATGVCTFLIPIVRVADDLKGSLHG